MLTRPVSIQGVRGTESIDVPFPGLQAPGLAFGMDTRTEEEVYDI